MTPPLSRAIVLAVETHGDQRDHAGELLALHALRVMHAVAPADRIVAVLHDVLEDTPTNAADLEAAGFEGFVVAAVEHLTRRPHEDYPDYIRRVRGHSVARRVKIADLRDNLDPARMARLPAKTRARLEPRYREALRMLGADAGSAERRENIFGKIRGRFDEDAARECDRALPEAAIAAIVAMPPDEFRRFQQMFAKVFWRGPQLGVVVEEEQTDG